MNTSRLSFEILRLLRSFRSHSRIPGLAGGSVGRGTTQHHLTRACEKNGFVEAMIPPLCLESVFGERFGDIFDAFDKAKADGDRKHSMYWRQLEIRNPRACQLTRNQVAYGIRQPTTRVASLAWPLHSHLCPGLIFACTSTLDSPSLMSSLTRVRTICITAEVRYRNSLHL